MLMLGCDHGGYELKLEIIKYLEENNFEYKDFGCNGEAIDYPIIAKKVCNEMKKDGSDKAILLCGTGIGISMAANKIKGIRAANCADCFSAKYTRLHNDANVLCMGGRTVGPGLGVMIADIFLNTGFEGGRHLRRINMLEDE